MNSGEENNGSLLRAVSLDDADCRPADGFELWRVLGKTRTLDHKRLAI